MIRLKAVPLDLQLGPQLRVIVDLAVEDDGQVPIGGAHRLDPTGEIDDGKSPMTEVDAPVRSDKIPLGVRATMGQRTGHSLKKAPIPRSLRSNEARNPTHQLRGKFLVFFTR